MLGSRSFECLLAIGLFSIAPACGGRRGSTSQAPVVVPSKGSSAAAEPRTTPDGPEKRASVRQVEPAVPDAEASRAFLAHVSEPGLALGSTAPPRVTALGLENTARGEAMGMSPRGEIVMAILREGERATASVRLDSGECATFIAQGGLGAIEVDLFLTTAAGTEVKIVAEDPTSGPIAVIGGRGACFQAGRASLAAELHVRMRRGAGAVVVRSYRR